MNCLKKFGIMIDRTDIPRDENISEIGITDDRKIKKQIKKRKKRIQAIAQSNSRNVGLAFCSQRHMYESFG